MRERSSAVLPVSEQDHRLSTVQGRDQQRPSVGHGESGLRGFPTRASTRIMAAPLSQSCSTNGITRRRAISGEKAEFVVHDGKIPRSYERMTVQSCFGQHFVVVLAMQHVSGFNLFHALVMIVNTPKEAQNFTYQLEMRDGDRTLTWISRPSSVLEGVEAAMARGDGLVFDARSFAVKLSVGVTVKRRSPGEKQEQDGDTRDSYFRMFGPPGKPSGDVRDGECKRTADNDADDDDFRDSYFRMFKPRTKQYP
ncbi:seven in absentia homolog 3 isoform X1 [Dermacentor silvarum]|uniref:seven in absentia homolog 3 isoform X1 n=1 Tax=Dermacentor silvarum TaxID=543639 RepID=UPI00189B5FA0|nr:seven in absentia homolog 3 isoform X1 [Dermacentor silvarum]